MTASLSYMEIWKGEGVIIYVYILSRNAAPMTVRARRVKSEAGATRPLRS